MPDVVLAEIDDKSLETYGPFGNWSHTLHAQAVTSLAAAGARVIVLDLLFVDPAPEDAALGEAIKKAGNVILAVSGAEAIGTGPGERYEFKAVLAPQEPLKSAAFQLAHVNFPPDPDGVLRRLPLLIHDTAGKTYPSVVVAAVYAESQRPAPTELPREGNHTRFLNQRVPVDEAGAMRPDFTAKSGKFARFSYGDAIAGRLDADKVRGKIVIIGLTATGSGDTHLVPLAGEDQPGIAVLGNAIESIKNGVFVREVNRDYTALALLPLVAVTMYAVPRFNLRIAALLIILVGVGHYAFSFALFSRPSDEKLVMNLVYPALLLVFMYLVGLAYRNTAQRADQRELTDLFGRYASPEIVAELASSADRGELELGGTLREVTVLFADLRGFTGVSERMPPAQVVAFLNEAFGIMISSIVRNEGIVNKFGGDCVMAIWNAPRDVTDHAIKACRAALEALAEMKSHNLEIPDDPDAKFGFGINTGEVVAGNVGSAGRLEYSVIGDAVNVASRLCGIAPGGEVYIGERTRELADYMLEIERLGPQTVKGRSRPVEAYQVLRVAGTRPVAAAARA